MGLQVMKNVGSTMISISEVQNKVERTTLVDFSPS
jgi:hypothetical protein